MEALETVEVVVDSEIAADSEIVAEDVEALATEVEAVEALEEIGAGEDSIGVATAEAAVAMGAVLGTLDREEETGAVSAEEAVIILIRAFRDLVKNKCVLQCFQSRGWFITFNHDC